jgi:ElaB/YqjD/DUF883 family membrane-anchored ribosome-binding protein
VQPRLLVRAHMTGARTVLGSRAIIMLGTTLSYRAGDDRGRLAATIVIGKLTCDTVGRSRSSEMNEVGYRAFCT